MNTTYLMGALPRSVDLGIDDNSVPPQELSLEQVPQHFPIFFIKAQKGDYNAHLVTNGLDIIELYGRDTIDPNKDFFNHQTALMLQVLSRGNACFINRIPTNATAGKRTLIAVVKQASIQPQWRNEDGSVVSDIVNENINGYEVRIKLTTADVIDGANEDWDSVNGDTAYPLFTLFGTDGELSNNSGIRIWPANGVSAFPTPLSVMEKALTAVYNMQVVHKSEFGSVSVVQSRLGDPYTKVAFKPGAFDYTNPKVTFGLGNIITNYTDDGTSTGTVPVQGEFSKMTLYRKSVAALTTLLYNNEQTARTTLGSIPPQVGDPGITVAGDLPAGKFLIDFLSGVDYDGNPYYGFTTITTGTGVITAARDRTIYLTGGTDGDLTDEPTAVESVYDAQTNPGGYNPSPYEIGVMDLIDSVESETNPLIDTARFPFKHIYDSGFSMVVKRRLMEWVSIRPSSFVTVGTHIGGISTPISASVELSRGISLVNSGKLFVESDTWGTPVCRICVVMQSGLLADDSYDSRVSNVFELAIKRAQYMGASDGILKPEFSYDSKGGNIIENMKDVSLAYLPQATKSKAWNGGLIYCQSFDMHRNFFPSTHTVYETDESVLTGDIFVQICCDLKLKAEQVWRIMTNNSDLTPAQFAEEATKEMEKLVYGKYGTRVMVKPVVTFTPADTTRGYSWTMTVNVYGNVPKTVQQTAISVWRQE